MTLGYGIPPADDPAACTRRAQQLLAQAHAATGFWRRGRRLELLAEAQVYAILGTRAAAEITVGRPLPRRSGT